MRSVTAEYEKDTRTKDCYIPNNIYIYIRMYYQDNESKSKKDTRTRTHECLYIMARSVCMFLCIFFCIFVCVCSRNRKIYYNNNKNNNMSDKRTMADDENGWSGPSSGR